jgi:hypothetical protein
MTVWEAAEKYLQIKEKSAMTAEIAAVLAAHGFETKSSNLRRGVYQALLKKPGIFARPAKGVWRLKVWEKR